MRGPIARDNAMSIVAPESTLRFTGRGGALDLYAGSFRPLYPAA